MKKNRILLSIATVALGIAMVGVANAGTINDDAKPNPAKSGQHQAYMTQENLDAMYEAMQVTTTGETSQDTENKDTNKDTAKTTATDNKQSVQMGPQVMNGNGFSDFQKQMTEIHQKNQERMVERHQENRQQMSERHNSMPNQSMKNKNFDSMPGNGPQNGAMKSPGSGMASGHNGNTRGGMMSR